MDSRESCGDADRMEVAGRQAHLSFTPAASASAQAPFSSQALTLQVSLSGLDLRVPQQAVLTVLSFPAPKQEITESKWKWRSLALSLSEMSRFLTQEFYVLFSQEGSCSTNRNFNIKHC